MQSSGGRRTERGYKHNTFKFYGKKEIKNYKKEEQRWIQICVCSWMFPLNFGYGMKQQRVRVETDFAGQLGVLSPLLRNSSNNNMSSFHSKTNLSQFFTHGDNPIGFCFPAAAAHPFFPLFIYCWSAKFQGAVTPPPQKTFWVGNYLFRGCFVCYFVIQNLIVEEMKFKLLFAVMFGSPCTLLSLFFFYELQKLHDTSKVIEFLEATILSTLEFNNDITSSLSHILTGFNIHKITPSETRPTYQLQ